ncbi:MAG: DUF1707 SHOCT-like domain-containing protein [Acidimicrobiales bacterium]
MDGSYRVSDSEREEVVLVLRHHLLEGRLTIEEFTDRVELAYGARVADDLLPVRADLPEVAVARPTSPRKRTRLTAALCGHVVRRGPLRLGRRTLVAGAFADVDLDLRQAEIDNARSTVMVLLACGNVDVYVPAGVNVQVSGLTIFGHRRDRGSIVSRPDAPMVHVWVFGCFATADIWHVPHDVRGSYKKIIRQVERRERHLPA